MKAGYRHAFETTNEFVQIRFRGGTAARSTHNFYADLTATATKTAING
jgi:hypothetical protein